MDTQWYFSEESERFLLELLRVANIAIHELIERQTAGLAFSLRLLQLRVKLIGQNNKLSAARNN